MKTSFLLAVLAALPMGYAQSLAPSPTESVGCEPHGDHWHCDGPRETGATSGDHGDDHDHAAGTKSLAPSPTESIGCEPHGDHWHCDGPRETEGASEGDHDHDHSHDQNHTPGSGSLAPSPTESIGCEPHGDHWHCDGPKPTGTPSSTPSSNAQGTSSTSDEPGAAATAHALPIIGLVAAAIFAL